MWRIILINRTAFSENKLEKQQFAFKCTVILFLIKCTYIYNYRLEKCDDKTNRRKLLIKITGLQA